MGSVTRLPCETYRTDIPASLRALADELEQGVTEMPESLVIVSSGESGVSVFGQGLRADDDILTIGLLELAKGLVVSAHSLSED
ncbi:hypothetical protein ACQKFL_11585 [Vreelandella titanicae]|uniref:hypothetical protein n=1 Tax=Vreelandella titanicae TaxID=664683 RepID=UPI003D088511